MERNDVSLGLILGEIGCKYRSIIESHIKDYQLQKGDDVEWLLEPLDSISHSPDILLDAYKLETKWESFYELYFHNKNATLVYVPYDKPYKEPQLTKKVGNTIVFLEEDEIEKAPDPNPYEKTMLIKDGLNCHAAYFMPSIWDELIIQFTELGVWQAVLLDEAIAMFPKGWHANYLNKNHVFSRADMQHIIDSCKSKYYDFTDAEFERLEAYYRFLGQPDSIFKLRGFGFRKSDYERLASYIDCEDIIPSVEINGDKAIVTYCYWNDWEGFCKRIITVERHNQSVVFSKTEKKVLVEYDCGITY